MSIFPSANIPVFRAAARKNVSLDLFFFFLATKTSDDVNWGIENKIEAAGAGSLRLLGLYETK